MIKKIDGYVLRTFFGPFIFIFSFLFFIFIVQFAWQELDRFMGKGLSLFQIMRLLLYWGVTVIQLVLPLTILLSSIMAFGELGENYELTAAKAAGISLWRIMLPLFFLSCIMGGILFYFSNNVIPEFQYKAKNMLINITNTSPALSFEEGRFIQEIPSYAMKINQIKGENRDEFYDIIMHKMAPTSEDQQTILAKSGTLQPTDNKYYLQFQLYDGYLYMNENSNKSLSDRKKQEQNIVKFDTLVRYFDVQKLVEQALEDEAVSSSYKFLNYFQLQDTFGYMRKQVYELTEPAFERSISMVIPAYSKMDQVQKNIDHGQKYQASVVLDSLSKEEEKSVYISALNNLKNNEKKQLSDIDGIQYRMGQYNKAVGYQQNMLTYGFTTILFFLIGASLGSIIRKGGIGMPVVVAVIVFIIFFVLTSIFNQATKVDLLNPYLAAWLPNIILLPFAVFLTISAVNDSEILDINKYVEPLQKFSRKFVKSRNIEHSRYQ